MIAIACPGFRISASIPIRGANRAAMIDLACDVADSIVARALSFERSAITAVPIGLRKFSMIKTVIKVAIESTNQPNENA